MARKRKYVKGSRPNTPIQRKFRIGNRKSGVSAMSLSTKELLAVLSNDSKSKYHANAAKALLYRGNLNQ